MQSLDEGDHQVMMNFKIELAQTSDLHKFLGFLSQDNVNISRFLLA
jgi:hypothetical protein